MGLSLKTKDRNREAIFPDKKYHRALNRYSGCVGFSAGTAVFY